MVIFLLAKYLEQIHPQVYLEILKNNINIYTYCCNLRILGQLKTITHTYRHTHRDIQCNTVEQKANLKQHKCLRIDFMLKNDERQ